MLGRVRDLGEGGVLPKGVGPSTTLAWPGWKQPDIPVEVDTAQLKTRRREAGVFKEIELSYS
jgi:hypothetical protein